MPGAGLALGPPAKKMQAAEPQVRPRHPGPPCAMVLRLIRALGVPGLLATVAARIISPSNLTSASGCQDHTTSRPPAQRSSHASQTSIAPRCYARDDRPKRPSHRRGMVRRIELICPTTQGCMPAADWHDGQFAHDGDAGSVTVCFARAMRQDWLKGSGHQF